jgi:antitoxin component of RelBE/YafQ-DinJ toxin-antitoxin module
MLAHPYIAARVTSDTKERFAALVRRQGLSESALLKRLVAAANVDAIAVKPCFAACYLFR